MAEQFGELFHQNGYVTAIMNRHIEGVSAEDIWEKLSNDAERVKWLAPGHIDLYQGGRASLDFKDSYVIVDSEVTACEAPKLLEFSWSGTEDPNRPIRFELEEDDTGCHIKLSVSIPEDEVVARSCAGWEAHLSMLQAVVAGASVQFPIERFKACRDFYDGQLAMLMMSEVPVLQL